MAAGTKISKFKVWKERPPGHEQTELERMFMHNELDYNSSPEVVQKNNPIFQEFSESVFKAHFRKTKARLGLSGKKSK